MERVTYPVIVQYEVTSRCNQNCSFCYNVWRDGKIPDYTKLPGELSDADSLKIIDECGKGEVVRLILTGGEPFVRGNISDIIDRAKSYGMFVHVNTNGTLIPKRKDIVDMLVKHKLSVQVSFHGLDSHDGITGIPNSKDKTLEGIMILKERNVPVSVGTTVCNQSEDEINKTIDYFKSINVPIALSRAMPKVPWGENAALGKDKASFLYNCIVHNDCKSFAPLPLCAVYEDYEKSGRLVGSGCSAGFYVAAIGSNGRIRACTHSPEEQESVIEVGLKKAWEHLEPYRLKNEQLPVPCNECDVVSQCKATCREVINFYGTDPWITKPIKLNRKESEVVYSQNDRDFLLNTNFRLFDGAKRRSEPFGSIVVTGRKIFAFNKTATEVLDEISKNKCGNEIIGMLNDKYHIEKANLEKDVTDTLAFFNTYQVIEKI